MIEGYSSGDEADPDVTMEDEDEEMDVDMGDRLPEHDSNYSPNADQSRADEGYDDEDPEMDQGGCIDKDDEFILPDELEELFGTLDESDLG